MSKLILVSNRLPISADSDGNLKQTTGGLASALSAISSSHEKLWIGWAGIPANNQEEQKELTKKFHQLAAHPVFLSEEEIEGYYEGYANSTLWATLHGMTDRAQFSDEWAQTYKKVNQKFADEILENANDGDTVWVHDYHFFLLPKMLKDANPTLKVGFFLHTPFCSSDIFRVIPERNEILQGVAAADLIGFHTFNYMRHFRSSLLRCLGLEVEIDKFLYDGGQHTIGPFPIGHDKVGFDEACQSAEFETQRNRILDELDGRKMVLSVERLDYTKGIPAKLDAIELFLDKNPDQHSKVCFFLIAVPSRESVQDYAELTEEVQQRIGAINGKYGSLTYQPVKLFHRGFPKEALSALYSVADACLVTPLVDGMNLVAKEYVGVKNRKRGDRAGALILSEFAGAAAEMSQAFLVNPHHRSAVADTILETLQVEDEDKWNRLTHMQNHINKNHAGAWANKFIEILEGLSANDQIKKLTSHTNDISAKILSTVKSGKRASLFLDYDGTLRDFTRLPENAVPDNELVPLIQSLAQHIDVALVSGRPASFLEKHFGNANATLVAEHGYRIKRPTSKTWDLVNPHVNSDWQETVQPLLQQACHETPGTHLEEKTSSLVWHYRNTDPEFGLWQAKRLLTELTDLTANLPVEVHHGNKIVEIASQQVNKGVAVKVLMDQWATDVSIAAGDDQTDETMFSIATDHDEHFTIHTGDKTTQADYKASIQSLRELLNELNSQLLASTKS